MYRKTAWCGSVGQAVGSLLGDPLFLFLESAGFITLSGQWLSKLPQSLAYDYRILQEKQLQL